MPVLYSVLLRGDCSINGLGPINLSAAELKVTKAVFSLLTSIAKMDPETFQVNKIYFKFTFHDIERMVKLLHIIIYPP